MIFITPGNYYTDIDGLACAVAYSELLRHEGRPAAALLPGALNNTITPTIRDWPLEYETVSQQEARFVLVDVSNPNALNELGQLDQVTEIYDHHTGHETYWQERLGADSHIEFIGAAATLIWEQIVARKYAVGLSQISARLLYTAILSNTLNFNAELTHQRDHDAFAALAPLASLPENWPGAYYREVEQQLYQDVRRTLADDTKIIELPNLQVMLAISQLELWDGSEFIESHTGDIETVLAPKGQYWFHTTPSISERKNYLYTKDEHIKKLLTRAIQADFHGNIGTTSRLWLRKEILKELYKLSKVGS